MDVIGPSRHHERLSIHHRDARSGQDWGHTVTERHRRCEQPHDAGAAAPEKCEQVRQLLRELRVRVVGLVVIRAQRNQHHRWREAGKRLFERRPARGRDPLLHACGDLGDAGGFDSGGGGEALDLGGEALRERVADNKHLSTTLDDREGLGAGCRAGPEDHHADTRGEQEPTE